MCAFANWVKCLLNIYGSLFARRMYNCFEILNTTLRVQCRAILSKRTFFSACFYVIKRKLFAAQVEVKCAKKNASCAESCRTPDGEDGYCVSIKACDSLITLLRTQSGNPRVRNYLQRSTCGFVGATPNVCCSSFRGQTSSPNPNEVTPRTTNTPSPNTPVTSAPKDTETYRLPSFPECGLGNLTNGRIVGGIPAKLGTVFLVFLLPVL